MGEVSQRGAVGRGGGSLFCQVSLSFLTATTTMAAVPGRYQVREPIGDVSLLSRRLPDMQMDLAWTETHEAPVDSQASCL